MYQQGFESPVRTARDIFGARLVSPIIRSETEISQPVSAKETVEHAADSSCRAGTTKEANAFVTCEREERGRTTMLFAAIEERAAINRRSKYVFYDFETTQNTRNSDTAKVTFLI